MHHHRAGADLDVVADADIAQHLGAGAHHHAVAQGGMALAFLVARAAQRHALVEQHIVADFSGFADHHAHAVVDEEAPADGGAGVDLDARQKAADLRDHARHQRHPPAIQPVRQAVQQDGVEAGVAEEDLDHALGGRVFPENGVDLFPDGSQHAIHALAVILVRRSLRGRTTAAGAGGMGASMSSLRLTSVEVL